MGTVGVQFGSGHRHRRVFPLFYVSISETSNRHLNILERNMLSQESLSFLLRLTDYFKGHWEDPNWGRRASSQILVGLAVRDLAEGIENTELRAQIQGGADKVIGSNSQIVART